MDIYLGTVALEKNRWAPGRIPTISVSDYLPSAKKAGFDGIELWANHYLMAQPQERCRIEHSGMTAIFNSYVTFADGVTEHMRQNAQAINTLHPRAIKFNLGSKDTIDIQLDTLRRFADLLEPSVRLLCECHSGTLMEKPEVAARVFDGLDERFGAIMHLASQPDYVRECFDCYGNRICHIHAQYSENGQFAPMEKGAQRLVFNFHNMVSWGFDGTMTVEFSQGQEPDEMYQNTVKDLQWLRTAL